MATFRLAHDKDGAYPRAIRAMEETAAGMAGSAKPLLLDSYILSRDRTPNFGLQIAIYDGIRDRSVDGKMMDQENVDMISIGRPGEFKPAVVMSENRKGEMVISIVDGRYTDSEEEAVYNIVSGAFSRNGIPFRRL